MYDVICIQCIFLIWVFYLAPYLKCTLNIFSLDMQQNLGRANYCLALNGEYSFLSSVASEQLLKEKTIDGSTNFVIFIGGHHVL